MVLRKWTMFLGVAFLGVGILGFVPALVTAPAHYEPLLGIHAAHGRLFGIFPVNVVHNLVHIAFGIWALAASRDMGHARVFNKANAIIYGLLAIAGLVPGLNTMFGLVPLYGHDVWLHALIAFATGYFAWVWEPGGESVGRRAPASGLT
jgi:hypothetical protein